MFTKVWDGRKQPVREHWRCGDRFYARSSIEEFANGTKTVRRVAVVNSEGNPVETVAQAIAEIDRLRTKRSEYALQADRATHDFVHPCVRMVLHSDWLLAAVCRQGS